MLYERKGSLLLNTLRKYKIQADTVQASISRLPSLVFDRTQEEEKYVIKCPAAYSSI